MGAPLFLLALLSTQTQEVCNGFSLKKQIVSTQKNAEDVPDLFINNFLHLL